MSALADELRSTFRRELGHQPQGVALAPGRVNLIGEHTDYNDGFVLPLAIEREVGVAFRARSDGVVRARSLDFGEEISLSPGELVPGSHRGWAAYVAGIAWALREEAGSRLAPVEGSASRPRGADLLLRGEVPIGAGLSSSAATELALLRALTTAWELPWDAVAMARVAQRAENAYVGVACGIMDQFASAVSASGTALLLDCRSLEHQPVPIPPEALVVIMDTGVRRSLTDGVYNERVNACREAVSVIRAEHPAVRALRDVTPELLELYRERMAPLTFRRATHVVAEIRRPQDMAEALRTSDLVRAGELMGDSHASLRDRYEVSSAELDHMVECACAHPACWGARLTGAGLGGCAVALVRRAAADDFIASTLTAYEARFRSGASLFATEPAAGARVR